MCDDYCFFFRLTKGKVHMYKYINKNI